MKNEKTRLELDQSNSIKLNKNKTPSLRFNDRAIKTLNTNFTVPNGDGTYRHIDTVRYKFDECKGKSCQGLILIHKKLPDGKYRKKLCLEYWFNGIAKRYHFPDYHPEEFNVREVEKRIADLREKYGNPNNLTWDLDINEGEQKNKINRIKGQLQISQIKTIREVIEEFYSAGFPKIKNDGTSPSRKTIKTQSRYLIGYNERNNNYKLIENESRNGVFVFKNGFNSWSEIFKRYPSKFNLDQPDTKFKQGVSIYDSFLSIYKINELTTELVNNYLSCATKASIKIEMKLALQYIWSFAINKGWVPGTPENPFREIKISKPNRTHMTPWNKKEFTPQELTNLYNGCEEIEKEYPGQPQLYQLEMLTGRRGETLSFLKWSNIEFKDTVESYTDDLGKTHIIKYFGVITVDPWGNKTNNQDRIPITQSIKRVLDTLIHRREKLEPWKRFVDWVFVSPRTPEKDYLRKDNQNSTFKSRMKDTRRCWNALLKLTGMEGKAMRKMFRTTYQNKVDRLEGIRSSWDAITITGQTDTRAHEQNYMVKKLTPKVLHHFNQIDEEFSNEIRTRKNN
jgi:integrase